MQWQRWCSVGLVAQCLGSVALGTQDATRWHVLEPVEATAESGAVLEVQADGSVLVTGEVAERDVYKVQIQSPMTSVTGFRLEALVDASLPARGPGRSAVGNFVLTDIAVTAMREGGSVRSPVTIERADADVEEDGYPVAAVLDGRDATGWAVLPAVGADHVAVFETRNDVGFEGGTVYEVTLKFDWGRAHTLGRFRLSITDAQRPLHVWVDLDAKEWRDLQEKINRAIDRGVRHLLDHQALDGSWRYYSDSYRNGSTSLCMYALLKSGVPASHPAIERAVRFLKIHPPKKTYSAGCQLLALAALKDSSKREWMKEIVDLLEEWYQGGLAYPTGTADISNLQYGVLGLWAAARSGVDVPRDLWVEIAKDALDYRYEKDDYKDGGFGYRPGHASVGSMTVGGVTVLSIALAELSGGEGLSPTERNAARAAVRDGVKWLAEHWTPEHNPDPHNYETIPWTKPPYYYLYGVERVAALEGLRRLGKVHWYAEGSAHLVKEQGDFGDWGVLSNTCFALLFLNRATASATGGGGRSMTSKTYGEDDPKADVSLRAAGDTPMTMWISSFGTAHLDDDGNPPPVQRVEYTSGFERLLDDEEPWSVSTRDPGEGWTAADFRERRWKETALPIGIEVATDDERNRWRSNARWLRKSFEVREGAMLEPYLEVQGRGGFEVFLDGVSIAQRDAVRRESDATATDDRDEDESLIGWWMFDERHVKRGKVTDRAGKNNGTVQGQPVVVDGVWPALKLDGRVDRVSLEYEPGSDGLPEQRMSVEAWVNLRAAGEWGAMIGVVQDNGGFEQGWLLGNRGSKFTFALATKGADDGDGLLTYLVADQEFRAGRWYHVVGTFDGRVQKIYVDGKLAGDSKTQSGPIHYPEDAVFVIGAYEDTNEDYPLAGLLREVRLHDDALHADRIEELYAAGRDLLPEDIEPLRVAVDPELLTPGPHTLAVRADGESDFPHFDLSLQRTHVLGAIDVDPDRVVPHDRYAIRHAFHENGVRSIQARVMLGSGELLQSDPLDVRIEQVLVHERLAWADAGRDNLLRPDGCMVTVSSESSTSFGAKNAVDGIQATAWCCKAGDARPTITIELKRPSRANTLLLTHLNNKLDRRDHNGRATVVEVSINGKEAGVIRLASEELRKYEWTLPRPTMVRKLELTIVEFEPGSHFQGSVGFAEVELQNRR